MTEEKEFVKGFPTDNVGDIHICGTCHQQFQDIELFITHKQQSCRTPKKAAEKVNVEEKGGESSDHQEESVKEDESNNTSVTYQEENVLSAEEGHLSEPPDGAAVSFTQQASPVQQVDVYKAASSTILQGTVDAGEAMQQMLTPSSQPGLDNLHHTLSPAQMTLSQSTDTALAGMLALNQSGMEGQHVMEIDPGTQALTVSAAHDITHAAPHGNLQMAAESSVGTANAEILLKAVLSQPHLAKGLVQAAQSLQVAEQVQRSSQNSVPEKKFSCPFANCKYMTAYTKDMERHKRIHTGEKPFTCMYCQRAFSRGDKLKIHIRGHMGNKPYKCDECSYAAADSSSLKKHKRIHTDERPFKCQICTYASRNSSQLIVHLRTHTGDSPYVCTICGYKFKINSDLKRHMRIHTGEKPFKCDFCDFKCSIKGNLNSHVRINHAQDSLMKCDKCDYQTSSKRTLREHQKVHLEPEDKPVKCPECDYQCTQKTALKYHQRVHKPERPYRCPHCTYVCNWSSNMQAHIKRKHPEAEAWPSKKYRVHEGSESHRGLPKRGHQVLVNRRPFQCPHCELSFVRDDSLRSHLKYHQDMDNLSKDVESTTYNTALAVLQLQTPVTMATRKDAMLDVKDEHNYGQSVSADTQVKESQILQTALNQANITLNQSQAPVVAMETSSSKDTGLPSGVSVIQHTLPVEQLPSGDGVSVNIHTPDTEKKAVSEVSAAHAVTTSRTAATLARGIAAAQAAEANPRVVKLRGRTTSTAVTTNKSLLQQLTGTSVQQLLNMQRQEQQAAQQQQQQQAVAVAQPAQQIIQLANPVSASQLSAALQPNLMQLQIVTSQAAMNVMPSVSAVTAVPSAVQSTTQPLFILQSPVGGDKGQTVAVPVGGTFEYPQGLVLQMPVMQSPSMASKVLPVQFVQNEVAGTETRQGMQMMEFEVATVDVCQMQENASAEQNRKV